MTRPRRPECADTAQADNGPQYSKRSCYPLAAHRAPVAKKAWDPAWCCDDDSQEHKQLAHDATPLRAGALKNVLEWSGSALLPRRRRVARKRATSGKSARQCDCASLEGWLYSTKTS